MVWELLSSRGANTLTFESVPLQTAVLSIFLRMEQSPSGPPANCRIKVRTFSEGCKNRTIHPRYRDRKRKKRAHGPENATGKVKVRENTMNVIVE